MTPETVMSIAYQAMMVTLYLGAPLLLTALLIGLLVSLFSGDTLRRELRKEPLRGLRLCGCGENLLVARL